MRDAFCAIMNAGEEFVSKAAGVGIVIDALSLEQQEQAGRDLWFTRQGHGTGFWDRDEDTYAISEHCPLGGELIRDRLDMIARGMGEVYVHVSRGWIYVE
jgi:hypothetical protein